MSKTKSNPKHVVENFMLEPKVKTQLADASFIFSVFAAFYLLLCFISYHAKLFWVHGENAGGVVGQVIATFSFKALGYATFFLPFVLVWSSWYFLKASKEKISRQTTLTKCLGAIPLFIGLATFLSLLVITKSARLPYGSGGLFGFVIAMKLETAFSIIGAYIITLALLSVGLTLVFSINWLTLCEWVGRFTVNTLLCISPTKWIKNTLLAIKSKISHIKRPKLPLKAWLSQLKIKKRLSQKSESEVEEAFIEQENPQTEITPNVYERQFSNPTPVAANSEEPKITHEQPEPVKTNTITINKKAEKPQPKAASVVSFKRKGQNKMPSIKLLRPIEKSANPGMSNQELEQVSRDVEQRLLDFGVDVQVVAVHPGPVITRFELQLAPGLKVSKITNLVKDLARSLSVNSVRVVEVIPGKSVVGLELPNLSRDMVGLQEVLASKKFKEAQSPLTVALGVDISGFPMLVDLAKMPHLLVAGTTGSGKSVGINAMILSLLFKASPDQIRLILVDPKMLELSVYEGIPHLLTPVVTDMKDAANALRWSVAEMERRYRLMAALGVRNIAGFNKKVKEAIEMGNPIPCPISNSEEQVGDINMLETLPYIVIVIDELADMMMVVGKKVEQLIARIAQKARAAGIHLILATQRPSVDVLTGLIKSNIPTRISFQVSSKIDSRTILDQQGAEQLLGQGDMLYLAPGTGTPIRVHGAFVDDREVHAVVDALKQLGEPNYLDEVVSLSEASEKGSLLPGEEQQVEDSDPLYDEAVAFVIQTRRASISSVQRRFKIGYNRAARLVEEMERTGIVGPMENGGMREVLVKSPEES